MTVIVPLKLDFIKSVKNDDNRYNNYFTTYMITMKEQRGTTKMLR